MTDTGKTYVIRNRNTKLYLTYTKRKQRLPYWGRFVGHPGKRYGAIRFSGGPGLDDILRSHSNMEAVEVNDKGAIR